MGRYYALNSGETGAVAMAILRALPAALGRDILPAIQGRDGDRHRRPPGHPGRAVRRRAGAQRHQGSLCPAPRRPGLGAAPHPHEDRFRPAGTGWHWRPKGLPIPASPEVQAACLDFIVGPAALLPDGTARRLPLRRGGCRAGRRSAQPGRRAARRAPLSGWVARPDWNTILPAYARCVRITREYKERFTIDPAALCSSRPSVSCTPPCKKPGPPPAAPARSTAFCTPSCP